MHDSGLYAALEAEHSEQAEARRDNLDELINAGSYIDLTTDPDSDRVMDFLADAALDAGDGQAEEGTDSVQLMTLHSAKGLEYPNVYIVGMEEACSRPSAPAKARKNSKKNAVSPTSA